MTTAEQQSQGDRSAPAAAGGSGASGVGDLPEAAPGGIGTTPEFPDTAATAATATVTAAPGALSPVSRSRGLLRRHPVLVATAVAALLHVIWFFSFANSGGDLAAQDAWAEFVGRHPDSAYNLAWYGGMHPVSYSVVSPYVMYMIGVRTTMMVAGTVSAGLLALILTRCRGSVREPLWPALAGVYGLLCNALSGRVTFGLGAMFALGAVAAVFCWPRKWAELRWAKAAVAAPLAASPPPPAPSPGSSSG